MYCFKETNVIFMDIHDEDATIVLKSEPLKRTINLDNYYTQQEIVEYPPVDLPAEWEVLI